MGFERPYLVEAAKRIISTLDHQAPDVVLAHFGFDVPTLEIRIQPGFVPAQEGVVGVVSMVASQPIAIRSATS